MPGKFKCDACSREYPWRPELAGKRAKCKCGAAVIVPTEDPELAAAPEIPEESDFGSYDVVETPVVTKAAPPPLPAALSPVKPLAYASPAGMVAAPRGRAGPLNRCQACGADAPTKYVEFHQNIGMLLMRTHRSIRGNLCKACIHQNFWKMTGTTLAVGWLGTISLVLAPLYVISNTVRYVGCLSMKSSHSEA